ncbi:acyltransferase family protein [Diaphorobacter aerolatus]|uniref:acyltransferase family protein n=1 Tax=Diaphorobacter aerolatus TaxID=1288495 RepID=UPI0021F772AC|nr:acyltransferase family protein [Diaphorobacter aerolatus]
MQPAKPIDAQRFASLDGLRGVACVVVVICHYLQIYVPAAFEGKYPDLFGEKWWVNSPLNLLFNGHAAVILFFVLSGFVLSAPFFREWATHGIGGRSSSAILGWRFRRWCLRCFPAHCWRCSVFVMPG